MTAYEITETAYALITGGWTSEDKDLFIEENAKQDEENIMALDDIDRLFDEIARIENESHLES